MKKEIEKDGKSGILNIRVCDYFVNSTRSRIRKNKMETLIDQHVNKFELKNVYEFLYQGEWVVDTLLLDVSHKPYLGVHYGWCEDIRECQIPLDTDNKPTSNLTYGNAYQFESNGSICIGIFDGDNLQDNNGIYMLRGCTNIIPLVPETK